eukprot:403373498
MNSQVYTTGAGSGQLKYGFQPTTVLTQNSNQLANSQLSQQNKQMFINNHGFATQPQVIISGSFMGPSQTGAGGVILQQQQLFNNNQNIHQHLGQLQQQLPFNSQIQNNQIGLMNNSVPQLIQFCGNSNKLNSSAGGLGQNAYILNNHPLYFSNGIAQLNSTQFIKKNTQQDMTPDQIKLSNASISLENNGNSSNNQYGIQYFQQPQRILGQTHLSHQAQENQQMMQQARIANTFQIIQNQDQQNVENSSSLNGLIIDMNNSSSTQISGMQISQGRNLKEIYEDLSTNSNQLDSPNKSYSDLAEMGDSLRKEKQFNRDAKSMIKMRRQQQNMIQKIKVVKSAPLLAKIDGCFYYKVKEINKVTRRLNSVLICAECNKPFTKKCNLIDHLRVHSGMKPFQCKICCKYFKQKAQLSKHCKKHGLKKGQDDENDIEDDMMDFNNDLLDNQNSNDQSQESSTIFSNLEDSISKVQKKIKVECDQLQQLDQSIHSEAVENLQNEETALTGVTFPYDSNSKKLLPVLSRNNSDSELMFYDQIRKDSEADELTLQISLNIAQSFCPFQKDIQISDQQSA